MKFDYFLATRWRNKDAAQYIANKIREKGMTVYSSSDEDKSILDPISNPEEAMKTFESMNNWQNIALVRKMFEQDMDGLRNSKKFILLLPAGKSAHMEAGVAYGLGKECILIGEQKETESLYLVFSEYFSTSDDFLRSL